MLEGICPLLVPHQSYIYGSGHAEVLGEIIGCGTWNRLSNNNTHNWKLHLKNVLLFSVPDVSALITIHHHALREETTRVKKQHLFTPHYYVNIFPSQILSVFDKNF